MKINIDHQLQLLLLHGTIMTQIIRLMKNGKNNTPLILWIMFQILMQNKL